MEMVIRMGLFHTWAKLKHNRTLRYSFSIADNKELHVEASHRAAYFLLRQSITFPSFHNQ